MERAVSQTNGHVGELSREESRELFDQQAERYLGMSGEAFVEAWDSNAFKDPDDSPEVMRVAMLLPLIR